MSAVWKLGIFLCKANRVRHICVIFDCGVNTNKSKIVFVIEFMMDWIYHMHQNALSFAEETGTGRARVPMLPHRACPHLPREQVHIWSKILARFT